MTGSRGRDLSRGGLLSGLLSAGQKIVIILIFKKANRILMILWSELKQNKLRCYRIPGIDALEEAVSQGAGGEASH